MMAIASISAARKAPSSPSGPGAARRLPATAASSAKLRKTCRPGPPMTGPSITRSARDLRRGQHNDRVAGADQPAVHLGSHFFGDDMRVDRILDHGGADEEDQLGARPHCILMGEGVADAGN